jgi:hypothetical protein
MRTRHVTRLEGSQGAGKEEALAIDREPWTPYSASRP